MKRCPDCGRTYTNNTLVDCLNDGTPLVEVVPDTVSYYGAPPPSGETLSPAYPEDASLEDEEGDDEEEAPAYSGTPPAYTAPPPYAAPMPNYATPSVNTGAPSPYFSSVQKSRPRVSWRGIALVCFVIFGLVRFGLHLAQNQQSNSSALISGPAAPSTPDVLPDLFPGLKQDKTLTETADGTLRLSLISAIKKANAAETKAVATLNLAPLHTFYAGSALASELDEVQALKKAGVTKQEQLAAQKFHTFQVNPEHTKAEVDEIETWSTITRSAATGKITSKKPSTLYPQIVSLRRTSRGWVVENTQFYGLQ